MGRGLGWVATACGALMALPFWVGSYVPLVDLPQHLAVAAVLRSHGDPSWGFSRFYEVEWLKLTPYWTYYLVLDGLSLLLPLDVASRAYLSLYALAVPWTGLVLCSAFGAPRWAGLLMAPLALNTNLYFGFVAYVTGVLVLLVLLAGFQRFLDLPTARRAATLVLLSCVLFFTHVQPFAFLVPAAFLLAVVPPSPPSLRRRLALLLVFAPATLLLFAPWVYREFVSPRPGEENRYNFGTVGELGSKYQPRSDALAELPTAVAGAYQDGTDTLLFAAWVGVVATLLAAGWRRGAAAHAWRARRLAGLALICCLAAPFAIQGQWNIAPRFAWLAALLIVAAMAEPGRPLSRAGGALAVLLTLAAALNALRHHREFGREAEAFTGVVDAVPRGQRVLSLVYDNRSRVFTQFPYLHFGQYVMAFRGGAAGVSLAKSPPFPVRHRRPEDFPAPDPLRPQDFRPAEWADRYDYFVARAGPAEDALFAGAPVRPVMVYERAPWRVWRNASAPSPR